MKLKFAKMHGLGNDFVIIDAITQPFEPRPELVRRWADRFEGIGFDQMLIVERPESEVAAFKYRIYNASGNEVAQCGNGARCFARFVRERGMTDLDIIPVETSAGMLTLEAIDATRYRVNMGIPRFEPAAIPLLAEAQQDLYQTEFEGREISFGAVSIGNPHMVILVDDINHCDIETLGPYFESHRLFPAHANIGFLQIRDHNTFKLRVFERGVGETRACGSGACAAMVVGVRLGLLENNARAILRGGKLNLEWQGDTNPVMMTGETAMVYQGEIEYE